LSRHTDRAELAMVDDIEAALRTALSPRPSVGAAHLPD
jgi:hypothetical protein